MNLEILKKDLSERYFSMMEYFARSFEIFKIFIKRHPILLISYFLFTVCLNYFMLLFLKEVNIINKIIGNNPSNSLIRQKMNELLPLISNFLFHMFCIITIFVIINFIGVIIRKKVGLEIEGESKNFKLSEIILKFLIIMAITIGGVIFFGITLGILAQIIGSERAAFLFLLLLLIFILSMLYFEQAYYLRNINIIDAFKYNLHISKRNRLKIIFPTVICFAIFYLISYAMDQIFLVFFGNVPALNIIIFIVSAILATIHALFNTTIENLIYLNLEYMDMREIRNTDKADSNEI